MFTNKRLHLFCKVVDNFGDIGICWRLSRQLQQEYGLAVTLWVDDLASFRKICPEIDVAAERQQVAGVAIRHWRKDEPGAFSADDVADIVIEFFACDIPENYIAAMALRQPRAVWLNLEGLTAEEWVEGCHKLPSSHPRLPLTKYFFFPGFTDKTGGLLCEAVLDAERRQFLEEDAAPAFLSSLGVRSEEMAALKVSLFCYPHAPVAALFEAWQNGSNAITCLIPEGVAGEAVQAFLGQAAKPGAAQTRGALTVRVLPFLRQTDYDKLLWACDLNFVRGEDSFVRAQWAGKPFIWHIYPQDENLHHKKLKAFLQRYAGGLESLAAVSLHWNGATQESVADWPVLWETFHVDMPKMTARAEQWRQKVLENGDLATNLLHFAASIQSDGTENTV